ncbi:PI-actitoxin-Afv2a-like [Hermetia illucens]|uniref:PI-actitoxin-Afv2a-like n=1 Tax=Hermetia illucens TaxID=343691 RepID=UPI0018CC1A8B|nr:PI-actitoxin-Afv2a-like [Hermetia illucens]
MQWLFVHFFSISLFVAIFASIDSGKRVPKNPICLLPKKVGICNADIDRVFYNSTSGLCEVFSWSGCEKNDNNFRLLYDCIVACIL